MKIRPLKFPEDETQHNSVIEWWYFNGHLKDGKGSKYAYMNCFFKADAKRIKLPHLKAFPFKNIYFSHSIFTNIKAKKSIPRVDYVSLVSNDSFSKEFLFVNYANPLKGNGYINNILEQKDKNNYRIKTEDFDLNLMSTKEPLLENGNGYIDFKPAGSYYYSHSNLDTKGSIRLNDKYIKVQGKSWMDHQWANVSYNTAIKWTWFSIQLDNNVEIVCFEVSYKNYKYYLATISYQNNRQESTNIVKLTPMGVIWISPVTKAKYPLSWKIQLPSKGIELEVKPMAKKQEVLFGAINYWEGPLEVSGVLGKKKVKGVGFLELVGYPKGVSDLKIYKNEVDEKVIDLISFAKKKGRQFFRNLV